MRLIITNIGTRDRTERGAEGKDGEMGWRGTKPTSSTHLNEATMGRGPAVGRDAEMEEIQLLQLPPVKRKDTQHKFIL